MRVFTYVRYTSNVLRIWFVLLALASFSIISHAQPVVNSVDSMFQRFMVASTAAGESKISLGNPAGIAIQSAQTSANLSMAGGQVNYARTVEATGTSGIKFPVKATAIIPAIRVAKILSGALRVGSAVGLAVTFYEVAKYVGYKIAANSDGSLSLQKESSSTSQLCTVSPCYEYYSVNTGSWFPTISQAFNDSAGRAASGCTASNPYSLYLHDFVSSSGEGSSATVSFHYAYCNDSFVFTDVNTFSVGSRSHAPYDTHTVTQADIDGFEAAVANRSNFDIDKYDMWLKSINDAANLNRVTVFNDPNNLDVVTIIPSVTGPASTPVKTVTTTSSDGSSLTKTTVDRHSYVGDTVTTNAEETSVKYEPSTNKTTTSVKSTIDHSVQASTAAGTVYADPKTVGTTPVGTTPVAEDPCKSNPDRLGCLSIGTAPTSETLPNKQISLSMTPVSFASSASCPADMPFTVIGHTYAISWSALCDNMRIVKALVLMLCGVIAAFILADSFRIS